jgi:hypothetical protein
LNIVHRKGERERGEKKKEKKRKMQIRENNEERGLIGEHFNPRREMCKYEGKEGYVMRPCSQK